MSVAVENHGESLSRLKKGYRPVMVRRAALTCEFGCIANFRSDWDKQQHMIYAHEMENGQTTLRSINEAVRNLGKTTPLPTADSYSAHVSSNKKGGDWMFVPRSSQSVRNVKDDRQSTKTGNSAWKGGLTRVLSFSRKRDDAPNRSIRIADISNPIPHPRSLETAERIGTDLDIARRHHRQLSNYTNSGIEVPSAVNEMNRRIFDNPIMLEDKDFDSASEGSDYSSPSSPSPISTPLDVTPHHSAELPPKHPFTRTATLPPPILTNVQRPPPLPRSPGSFSRPTPAAYPMLLRQYLDTQEQLPTTQSPIRPSPTSAQPASPNRPRPLPAIPTRPPRPPVPSRNPARSNRSGTSSEEGHGPVSYQAPSQAWILRKSPSHGAIRI